MLNLHVPYIASPGRSVVRRWLMLTGLHLVILQLALFVPASSADTADPTSSISARTSNQMHPILAQAETDSATDPSASRPLEPRYQPREPEEKSWYNDSYIFAMTRGLADSTIAPAGKAPLFLFTVPLDIAFLPFAIIGGLFG